MRFMDPITADREEPDVYEMVRRIDFSAAHDAAVEALNPLDVAVLLLSLPTKARNSWLSSLGKWQGIPRQDVPQWALTKVQGADRTHRLAVLPRLLPTLRKRLDGLLPELEASQFDSELMTDWMREFSVGALRVASTSLGLSGKDVSRLLLALATLPDFILDDESFEPLSQAFESLKASSGEKTPSPSSLNDIVALASDGVDVTEDLDGAIRAAEKSLERGRLASERIRQDLSEGLAPALDDIQALCILWARLDALCVVSSNGAAGLSDAETSRSIDSIIGQSRLRLQTPVPERLQVERLLTVEGPENLEPQLEDLRVICRAAVAAETGKTIEGLELLVRLIDLGNSDTDPDGSYQEIQELSRQVLDILPEELGSIVIAAVRGRLRFVTGGEFDSPSESDDADEESPNSDRSTEASQASAAVDSTESFAIDSYAGDTSGDGAPVDVRTGEQGEAVTADTLEVDDRVHSAESVANNAAVENEAELVGRSTNDRPRVEVPQVAARNAELDINLKSDSAGPPPSRGNESRPEVAVTSISVGGIAAAHQRGHDKPSSDGPSTQLLSRLVSTGRWTLAYHLEVVHDRRGPAAAYAGLAYSSAASSSDGACAASFSEVTTGLNLDSLQGQRGAVLAAVVGAIRISLVAPLANGPAVIGSLRPAFTGLRSFNALLDAVTQSALRGIDITAMASTAATIAAADDAIAAIVQLAQQKVKAAPTRTLKFTRATRVWQRWTAPDGMLGSLLDIVARDQRDRVSEARARVLELRGRRALADAMDDADARLRNGPYRGEAIEAGARTRLLDWASDILDLVSNWCTASNEQSLAGESGTWQQEPLMELRASVREHGSQVQSELQLWAAEDELVRSHVEALLPLLDSTWRMCDGQVETSPEPPAAQVIAADLLAVATVRFDSDSALPTREPTFLEIEAAAAAPAIEEWYSARADGYDHIATGLIVEFLGRSDEDAADRLASDRQRRIDLARTALEDLRTSVVDLLAQARRQGYVDEDAWTSLAANLEANNPAERLDLDVVRTELETVKLSIAKAKLAAIAEFETELTQRAASDERVEHEAGRIRQLITLGDLATAQEALLLVAERGESLPDLAPESTLELFNTAVEQAGRASNFDTRLVVAARDGASWGPFHFGSLDDTERVEVSESFASWLGLSEPGKQSLTDLLRPILRLGGIEAASIRKASTAGVSDRVWFDLEGVVRTGRALVPAFGSALGMRLRLLVCKKSTSIKVLEEWLKQDGGTEAVLVIRPGVTTARDRRELFDHFRSPQRQRTIGLIDDSVVAWLGTKGGRHFDELMKVVLPWAAHNPYTPHALGRVPVEMFYGRNQAVASVISPTGAVFIYGGRQLGKSALLRAAARRFEDAEQQVAIYADLYSENIGRTRPATAIWETLWKLSLALGIVAGKSPVRNAFDSYRDAVLAWLRKDDRRRLLILLDEADRFLDADAENGFSTTAQIKGLMEDSDRRCKVVFAGLHTVQRFVGLPNEPLTNIANPMSIGPMEPKAAFDLVTRPLEALGYRFVNADVANRILAYCNFYPSLIQLFADALVTRMLESPLTLSAPPQIITAEDIEAVYSSAELSDAFRHRLNLTLGLDEHYQAIAYTVALMALTGKVDTPIPVGQLRERCREFWSAGFGSMAADQFRHLCDELVGLGVLARVAIDGSPNYRLRSPNVLRMLGTEEMVLDRLTSVSSRPAPTGFPASTARANLSDGSSSPLTAAQTAELLAPRSQVLIVVGSASGGINLVTRALSEAAGTSVEVQAPEEHGRIRVQPSTDGRHRVQLFAASNLNKDIRAAVEDASAALRRLPRGTTVAVIIIVDESRADELVQVFSDTDAAGRVVELGLLDGPAVRLLASERSLPFTEDSDVTVLLEETGGIRSAVEAVAARYAAVRSRPKALAAVTGLIETPEAAAAFVRACGIQGTLVEAFYIIMQINAPQTVEELSGFVREFSNSSEPAGAVRALLGLGALERLSDGRVSVPTLLARAWANSGL